MKGSKYASYKGDKSKHIHSLTLARQANARLKKKKSFAVSLGDLFK